MQYRYIEPGTVVRIRWLDSKSVGGWQYPDTPLAVNNLVTIRSIGYVVESTPQRLTITSSRSPKLGAALDPLSVPWGSITQCSYAGMETPAILA